MSALQQLGVDVTSVGVFFSSFKITVTRNGNEFNFYPRDAMLARLLAMALCLSVTTSQVGVLSKGMNGLVWFLAWRFLRTIIHCVLRKFRYL